MLRMQRDMGAVIISVIFALRCYVSIAQVNAFSEIPENHFNFSKEPRFPATLLSFVLSGGDKPRAPGQLKAQSLTNRREMTNNSVPPVCWRGRGKFFSRSRPSVFHFLLFCSVSAEGTEDNAMELTNNSVPPVCWRGRGKFFSQSRPSVFHFLLHWQSEQEINW